VAAAVAAADELDAVADELDALPEADEAGDDEPAA
jgi:hypothetical protein